MNLDSIDVGLMRTIIDWYIEPWGPGTWFVIAVPFVLAILWIASRAALGISPHRSYYRKLLCWSLGSVIGLPTLYFGSLLLGLTAADAAELFFLKPDWIVGIGLLIGFCWHYGIVVVIALGVLGDEGPDVPDRRPMT